ncbi:cupin domain-containing protein [Arthrobacter sp.]|uniref:cupin domain-containing protein n=1 Tax=Arthrobacter sp. TaxID=1667 RepID=UPI003A8F3C1A
MSDPTPAIRLLGRAAVEHWSGPSDVVTVEIELEPGSTGSAPHRHPGPVFAYLLEGELLYELEGKPEQVIRAGEAFWEPGGEVIHYQAANHLSDRRTVFVAVMVRAPGQEMTVPVAAGELAARAHLRHPRPAR